MWQSQTKFLRRLKIICTAFCIHKRIEKKQRNFVLRATCFCLLLITNYPLYTILSIALGRSAAKMTTGPSHFHSPIHFTSRDYLELIIALCAKHRSNRLGAIYGCALCYIHISMLTLFSCICVFLSSARCALSSAPLRAGGVMRGKGGRKSPGAESLWGAPNVCRGRRKVPTMSQVLSSIQ